MHVSHTTGPITRSANRTASRFSATGHQPGAIPSAPAAGRSGRACLRTCPCLVTAASSTARSPAAVRGPTTTDAVREWLPAASGRPGERTLTGTVILIVRRGRPCAVFHRLMVATRAAISASFTVPPASRGTAGTASRRSP